MLTKPIYFQNCCIDNLKEYEYVVYKRGIGLLLIKVDLLAKIKFICSYFIQHFEFVNFLLSSTLKSKSKKTLLVKFISYQEIGFKSKLQVYRSYWTFIFSLKSRSIYEKFSTYIKICNDFLWKLEDFSEPEHLIIFEIASFLISDKFP